MSKMPFKIVKKEVPSEIGLIEITSIETTVEELKKFDFDAYFESTAPRVSMRLSAIYGFSSDILYHEKVQTYLAQDAFAGWLGHDRRTKSLDRELEKIFFSSGFEVSDDSDVTLVDIFVTWLTSTDARSVADSLPVDGYKSEEYLCSVMKRIFEKGYIYSRPEHTGTLKSFIELKQKYKSKLYS